MTPRFSSLFAWRSAAALVSSLIALAPAHALSWSDWADLALASPVVLIVEVKDVDRLSRRSAPDVPPDEIRTLVKGQLHAALVAPSVLPGEAEWLWQGQPATRNRPPFSIGARQILFARAVQGGKLPQVQQLQLISPHGQQPWSPEAEAAVRAILMEARDPDARNMIVTGIADAQHVPGTIKGASESQFFLTNRAGRPLTLTVTRSPGAAPLARVATGELTGAAQPIVRDTLVWHALACGMPKTLPEQMATDAALAADYEVALWSVGECGRTLTPPAP